MTDKKASSNKAAPKLKFNVKRSVTLPILKIACNVATYVRIDDAIFQGKLLAEELAKGKSPEDAAYLVNVTDLETGEQAQIVLNKVLHSILDESYPNDGYVGLAFSLVKQKMATGKKYHNFTVQEIELEQ